MKKIVILGMLVIGLLGVTACGKSDSKKESKTESKTADTEKVEKNTKEENKKTAEKINKEILDYKEKGGDTNLISDKYHTFGELYEHRMYLTKVIAESYPEYSWKSWKHEDGTMFKDSFIVGFNTPDGQYSYHYRKENWDLFQIKELPNAPKFDGHKPSDIGRMTSLLKLR